MEQTSRPLATHLLDHRGSVGVGDTLCNRYTLTRFIGSGGMASVYAGVRRDGGAVAIKVLHERLSFDPDFEYRFRREAQLANTIKHPGVVPVQDIDVSEEGCSFLVMPLLDGETLHARSNRLGGRLSLEEAVSIGCALLEILEAAHACGIVHCDIKPENLLLTTDGELKVLDFGIARFFASSGSSSATRTGVRTGTPAFMAPEQAQGRTRELDARTDIWAAGATLFALLSGALVHEGDTPEVIMARAATLEPRPLISVMPGFDPGLCGVIDRALAFNSPERWGTAAQMREALTEAYLAMGAATMPAIPKGPPAEVVADVCALSTKAPVVPAPAARAIRPAPGVHAGREAVHRERRGLSGKSWALTIGLTSGLAIGAFALAGGLWTGRSRAHERSEVSKQEDIKPEALAAFEGGVQLWMDAATEPAREKFGEAAAQAPGFAAAHLLFAAISEWIDPEARVHLAEAQSLRSRLDPVQTAVLDALSPLTAEPPDTDATSHRLDDVVARYPADQLAWLALAAHDLRAQRIEHLRTILPHIDGILSLWLRARAELMSDDVEEARTALRGCVAQSAQATDCMIWLAILESNEGNCDASANAARSLIAARPFSSVGYGLLARAEFGRSLRTEAVRAILVEKWARIPEDRRSWHKQRDEFFLAVLAGRFDDAYAAEALWERAATSSVDAELRGLPFVYRIDLDLELGQPAKAEVAAREFADSSAGWLRNGFFDLPTEVTRTLYLAEAITRPEFQSRRKENEAGLLKRTGYLAQPGVRWFEAYVQTAKDAEDAREALQHAPSPLRVVDAVARDVGVDEEMGRVYLMAGRAKDALPLLERASRSCSYFKAIEYGHARLLYAEALEATGRVRDACLAYRRLLDLWGRDRRSISAGTARSRIRQLKCPEARLTGSKNGSSKV